MIGFGKSKNVTRKDLFGKLPDEFALCEEWVEIEGLGRLLIREMDSGQRDEWEWMLANRQVARLTPQQKEYHKLDRDQIPDPRGLKAFVISCCVIDPTTQSPMFPLGDREIDRLPSGLVTQLYWKCLEVCGLREADYEDAKKNSATTPASDDDSGSPPAGDEPLSS